MTGAGTGCGVSPLHSSDGGGGGAFANVAVTLRSSSSKTSQSLALLQAPPHPEKTAPESGAAASLTCVPAAAAKLQRSRQSGKPLVCTEPGPVTATVRAWF